MAIWHSHLWQHSTASWTIRCGQQDRNPIIALLETGLDGRVTKIEVTRARLYSPESVVMTVNPTGRVPTLELDGATVLTESQLILNYINALSPGIVVPAREYVERAPQRLAPRTGSASTLPSNLAASASPITEQETIVLILAEMSR